MGVTGLEFNTQPRAFYLKAIGIWIIADFRSDRTAYLKYNIFMLVNTMTETVELDNFDISFSFRCPKCDYQNEEISANDLSSGNAECGMCETIFKLEGLDAIKITALLE
jgi:hypothetical protein